MKTLLALAGVAGIYLIYTAYKDNSTVKDELLNIVSGKSTSNNGTTNLNTLKYYMNPDLPNI